jgi:hypothetical protein
MFYIGAAIMRPLVRVSFITIIVTIAGKISLVFKKSHFDFLAILDSLNIVVHKNDIDFLFITFKTNFMTFQSDQPYILPSLKVII